MNADVLFLSWWPVLKLLTHGGQHWDAVRRKEWRGGERSGEEWRGEEWRGEWSAGLSRLPHHPDRAQWGDGSAEEKPLAEDEHRKLHTLHTALSLILGKYTSFFWSIYTVVRYIILFQFTRSSGTLLYYIYTVVRYIILFQFTLSSGTLFYSIYTVVRYIILFYLHSRQVHYSILFTRSSGALFYSIYTVVRYIIIFYLHGRQVHYSIPVYKNV